MKKIISPYSILIILLAHGLYLWSSREGKGLSKANLNQKSSGGQENFKEVFYYRTRSDIPELSFMATLFSYNSSHNNAFFKNPSGKAFSEKGTYMIRFIGTDTNFPTEDAKWVTMMDFVEVVVE